LCSTTFGGFGGKGRSQLAQPPSADSAARAAAYSAQPPSADSAARAAANLLNRLRRIRRQGPQPTCSTAFGGFASGNCKQKKGIL